jgi:hypothetical protein
MLPSPTVCRGDSRGARPAHRIADHVAFARSPPTPPLAPCASRPTPHQAQRSETGCGGGCLVSGPHVERVVKSAAHDLAMEFEQVEERLVPRSSAGNVSVAGPVPDQVGFAELAHRTTRCSRGPGGALPSRRPRCRRRRTPPRPGIWTDGVASRAVSALSEPTTSWRTRPFGVTAVGASRAATSVGAMSMSAGCDSNGFTFGPTATITPSSRWSPLTQSASSIGDFACASE